MTTKKVKTTVESILPYLRLRKVKISIGALLLLLACFRLAFSGTEEVTPKLSAKDYATLNTSLQRTVKELRAAQNLLLTKLDLKAAEFNQQDYPAYESEMKESFDTLSSFKAMDSIVLDKFDAVEEVKAKISELEIKHVEVRRAFRIDSSAENFKTLLKVSAEVDAMKPKLKKKERDLEDYEKLITEALSEFNSSLNASSSK